jgi:hypothetical protein
MEAMLVMLEDPSALAFTGKRARGPEAATGKAAIACKTLRRRALWVLSSGMRPHFPLETLDKKWRRLNYLSNA